MTQAIPEAAFVPPPFLSNQQDGDDQKLPANAEDYVSSFHLVCERNDPLPTFVCSRTYIHRETRTNAQLALTLKPGAHNRTPRGVMRRSSSERRERSLPCPLPSIRLATRRSYPGVWRSRYE